jgi:hypothetical protein
MPCGAGSDPGQETGFWEPKVNVNCVVDLGLGFVGICCCRRLIFSWPVGIRSFSALAMAVEMMPEFSE